MIGTPHWSLHHVAHAVRDIDATVRTYRERFRCTVLAEETLPEHGVRVCFLQFSNSLIELISPLEGNSSLTKFLDTKGEALHHVCFGVPNLAEELKQLKSRGAQLIDEVPRRGALGHLVAFLHPRTAGGILVELCEIAA